MSQENHKVVSYNISEHFQQKWGNEPEVIIQSPGRINIIGEHTDYNDGFVLPAAISHYMFVALSKNGTNDINLYSIDYDQQEKLSFEEIQRSDNGWLNLISGVVDQISDKISGFDISFGGNIPEGSGLSSSAALCSGVTYGLSELFDLKFEKWDVVKIAQKSEHNFALVQCGIMDQFACMFGLDSHVLLLNCKNYEYEESEIDISGFRLLLINSNVKHNLGDSAYNLRKEESASALEILKNENSNIDSYQNVTLEMLDKAKNKMSDVQWNRALHVVSENDRVFKIKDALKLKQCEVVGELLSKGHYSLKNHYDVTCEETDFLVKQLNVEETVCGARQLGGGFGGCILALIKDIDTDQMLERINQSYFTSFGFKLDNIPVHISKGCQRIK